MLESSCTEHAVQSLAVVWLSVLHGLFFYFFGLSSFLAFLASLSSLSSPYLSISFLLSLCCYIYRASPHTHKSQLKLEPSLRTAYFFFSLFFHLPRRAGFFGEARETRLELPKIKIFHPNSFHCSPSRRFFPLGHGRVKHVSSTVDSCQKLPIIYSLASSLTRMIRYLQSTVHLISLIYMNFLPTAEH